MTLYDRIKFVADKRGMSLRDVATKSGFKSETAIYRYNQGVKPRRVTLEAIARTLRTNTDFLEGKTDKWNSISTTRRDAPSSSDIMDPVLTFDGKPITGEIAQQIRNYAEFLMNKERKNTSSNE